MSRSAKSKKVKVLENTTQVFKGNTEQQPQLQQPQLQQPQLQQPLYISLNKFDDKFCQVKISINPIENELFESNVCKYAVVVFHNAGSNTEIGYAENNISNENTYILVHGSIQSLKNIEITKRELENSYVEQGLQGVSLSTSLYVEVEISTNDIQEIVKVLDVFSPSKNSTKSKLQTISKNDLELFPPQKRSNIFQFIWIRNPENPFIQDNQFQEAIFTALEQLCLQSKVSSRNPLKRNRYKHKEFNDIEKITPEKKNSIENTLKISKVENRHVAIHLEKSQFGRTQPDPMSIMTVIHDTEVLQKAQEHNIELIGIDPSWNGFKAIAALQKALTRQGYKPEPEYIEVVDDEEIATSQGMLVQRIVKRVPNPMYNDEINSIRRAFKYQDGLPRLIYKTWTEYYEDFGVPKYETERGKIEYNGKIKLEAEEALASLVKNAFVWNYIRVRNPKTPKEVREDVTAYAPLIAAVQVVRNEISKELEYIEIIPSPVIVDQVSTHFLIYPSNLEDQVFRALNAKGKGRPPRYQLLFVKWLYLRAKENNLRPFSNTYRELGRILRMDAWIDTRQDKRVRDSLEKCFVVAINLNLVEKIDRANDKFTFYLNPEKFRRKAPKEIESNFNEINAA